MASQKYNEERFEATIRWAMLDQIRSLKDVADPAQDVGFHEVIRKHFFYKSAEIREQISAAKAHERCNPAHKITLAQLETQLFGLVDQIRL